MGASVDTGDASGLGTVTDIVAFEWHGKNRLALCNRRTFRILCPRGIASAPTTVARRATCALRGSVNGIEAVLKASKGGRTLKEGNLRLS
jgi:hypothetical protein